MGTVLLLLMGSYVPLGFPLGIHGPIAFLWAFLAYLLIPHSHGLFFLLTSLGISVCWASTNGPQQYDIYIFGNMDM